MNIEGLCRALGLGSDPEAVLAALRDVYEEVDRRVASALDLPCRAGCSACCHEAVFVSAPEFLAVAAALASADPGRRAAVVAEMRRLADVFADELELLEGLPAGAERDEVAARIKFRCPLLAEDERCSVYAVRELNARAFGLSHDGQRGEAYGCELTHERLRVLAVPPRSLPDARDLRRLLARRLPNTAPVHVYPWWFERYASFLYSSKS